LFNVTPGEHTDIVDTFLESYGFVEGKGVRRWRLDSPGVQILIDDLDRLGEWKAGGIVIVPHRSVGCHVWYNAYHRQESVDWDGLIGPPQMSIYKISALDLMSVVSLKLKLPGIFVPDKNFRRRYNTEVAYQVHRIPEENNENVIGFPVNTKLG